MSSNMELGQVKGVQLADQLGKSNRSIGFHVKTLYLFTRSDFKTIIFPQTIFALAAAISGLTTASLSLSDVATRLPLAIIWLWVHLLAEVIANQRLPEAIIEDSTNKPWRPLPSNRLTPEEALRLLLHVAIPASLAVAKLTNTTQSSALLLVFTWMYNDLDGASCSPSMKNLLNAAGIGAFGWGALATLTGGDSALGDDARTWIALLAAVVASTIQAQDLADMEGDKERGRLSAPFVWGETNTRVSVAVMVFVWSIACPLVMHAGWIGVLVVGGPGIAIIGLVLLKKERRADEWALKVWCLWITTIYLLPLLSRKVVVGY